MDKKKKRKNQIQIDFTSAWETVKGSVHDQYEKFSAVLDMDIVDAAANRFHKDVSL